MTKWKAIKAPPHKPMVVALFCGGGRARLYEEVNPTHAWDWSLPENQSLLIDLGYWDGKRWREVGTNHDVFEFDAKIGDPDKPTHWAELRTPAAAPSGRDTPAPPASTAPEGEATPKP